MTKGYVGSLAAKTPLRTNRPPATEASHTYRNGFHDPEQPGKTSEFLTARTRPVEWAGHAIYRRHSDCFDVVKDGVCVGMYVRLAGAKDCAERRQKYGIGADLPGSWHIPVEGCLDILKLAERLTARAALSRAESAQ